MDIYCKLANHLRDHIKIKVTECKISYFKSKIKNCKALIYQNMLNSVLNVSLGDTQFELHNEIYLFNIWSNLLLFGLNILVCQVVKTSFILYHCWADSHLSFYVLMSLL